MQFTANGNFILWAYTCSAECMQSVDHIVFHTKRRKPYGQMVKSWANKRPKWKNNKRNSLVSTWWPESIKICQPEQSASSYELRKQWRFIGLTCCLNLFCSSYRWISRRHEVDVWCMLYTRRKEHRAPVEKGLYYYFGCVCGVRIARRYNNGYTALRWNGFSCSGRWPIYS